MAKRKEVSLVHSEQDRSNNKECGERETSLNSVFIGDECRSYGKIGRKNSIPSGMGIYIKK